METGAFGWGFKDQIQPTLDHYDRQIDDIRLNGVEGQLARMQARDDALGITAGNAVGEAAPRVGGSGLIPLSDPPRGYGDDPNLRPAHLDASLLVPDSAPSETALSKNPYRRTKATAGGNTDESPALAAYTSNPTISAALDSAWAKSAAKYIDQRREVNAFGRQNSRGDIWVEPASTQYADSHINVSASPPGSTLPGRLMDWLLGNKTIFEIHTHPNPGNFQTTGPSEDDINASNANRLPLIIQSTDGIHYYDPALHR